ncbi:uncharacterized protein LOC104584985 [Brachypodium distachyon]|uniref:uncharacterized protein LOC104584985 n=1 Tax=Brachypodium distachyon TaxID=15368 RepID=UPI00052FE051|nr:uncharacterized protein LOC104584985 [Brachypodium distachyon]|eukprot:XP_010239157.1 uncharacterized protein LOC104584985 [Brachypodium distachyon]
MAVSHYAYLKLKMPGPSGVITVSGNFTRSDLCDKEFHTISESFSMHEEFEQQKASTGLEQTPISKKPAHQPKFNKKVDTKEVQVHPTDSSKTAVISTSLPPAQENALVEFLHERWEIFPWCQQTCQEFPGN